MKIRFALDEIYDYLLSFDHDTVAKILGTLELLEKFGKDLGSPKVKKINKDIYELRVISELSVRILFAYYKNDIFVLHAFVKKTQKLPSKELDRAISILKYLR